MRLFFKNKTAEQTFSVCLLISIVFIMIYVELITKEIALLKGVRKSDNKVLGKI